MKRFNQRGAGHAVLIVGVVIAVVVIGFFLFKGMKLKLPGNGKSQVSKVTKKEDVVLEVVKEHFKYIYNGDNSVAYDSTCNYFKEYTTEADFIALTTEGFFKAVDFSEMEYTEVEVANSQARLAGEIGPLVPDTMLEVDVLKENGKWCVAGYRTR